MSLEYNLTARMDSCFSLVVISLSRCQEWPTWPSRNRQAHLRIPSLLLPNVTGAAPATLIDPGSVSLSMNLSNVNVGNGFSVFGGGPQLNQFLADWSISIAADLRVVPEAATLALIGRGSAALAIGRLSTRLRESRGKVELCMGASFGRNKQAP